MSGGRGQGRGGHGRYANTWGASSISTKKLLEYAESDVSDLSDISSATLARVDLTKESSLTKVHAYLSKL